MFFLCCKGCFCDIRPTPSHLQCECASSASVQWLWRLKLLQARSYCHPHWSGAVNPLWNKFKYDNWSCLNNLRLLFFCKDLLIATHGLQHLHQKTPCSDGCGQFRREEDCSVLRNYISNMQTMAIKKKKRVSVQIIKSENICFKLRLHLKCWMRCSL